MHRTSKEDAETEFLAGYPVSASGPPLAGAVVLPFPFPSRNAAAYGPESEASSSEWDDLDEDVFQLGELAVRLTASWSLPRLQVLVAADPAWED
jgi:hypothetical protein